MKNLLIISTIATLVFGGAMLLADDDRERGERYERSYDNRDGRGYTNPNNLKSDPLYTKECGSCHMAYQPEFLPRRSWKKMMATLEDHFGSDATLEPEDDNAIFMYLMDNAADSKRVGKHYAKTADSIARNDAPLSISKTRYFIKEHRDIAQKYIDQKEVKSIANCSACHQKAEQGDYRERNIFIPNYGPWDD